MIEKEKTLLSMSIVIVTVKDISLACCPNTAEITENPCDWWADYKQLGEIFHVQIVDHHDNCWFHCNCLAGQSVQDGEVIQYPLLIWLLAV